MSKNELPTLSYKATLVPVNSIDPRENNRKIDPKAVKELAASIGASSLQQPITIRPKGKRHEIVAGERRWLAFKELGRKEIPAFIRNMTDQEAEEFALTENLQRQDLHPIEEAEAYAILLKHPDCTIDILAAKQGKTVQHVRHRLELLKLITPLRKMFRDGALGLEQAKQLCRIPPDIQKEFAEKYIDEQRAPSAAEIADWIQNNVMLDLARAPFKLDDPLLVKVSGACTDCPKHTGHDKVLFADIKKGDFCLDAPCFNRKVDALIKITVERDEPVPVSTAMWVREEDKKRFPKDTLYHGEYTLSQAGECQATTNAIVVHGDNRGFTIFICRDNTCKEHAGRHRDESSSIGESPKEREKRLTTKREEKAAKETRREIIKQIGQNAGDTLTISDCKLLAVTTFNRLWNVLQIKFMNVIGLEWDRKKQHASEAFEEYVKPLHEPEVIRLLLMLAVSPHMEEAPHKKDDPLLAVAKAYKVNLQDIQNKVSAKYAPKKEKAVTGK